MPGRHLLAKPVTAPSAPLPAAPRTLPPAWHNHSTETDATPRRRPVATLPPRRCRCTRRRRRRPCRHRHRVRYRRRCWVAASCPGAGRRYTPSGAASARRLARSRRARAGRSRRRRACRTKRARGKGRSALLAARCGPATATPRSPRRHRRPSRSRAAPACTPRATSGSRPRRARRHHHRPSCYVQRLAHAAARRPSCRPSCAA
mmetsp:Transcript_39788/g.118452  ORF Transcript_39788/g.118452 Transcript_39788/m.118452 type:complete len:204 (+) Transcript_39788:1382-1993(+)